MVKLKNIPVKILSTRTDDKGRCFATVVACMGEPFIDYSMGGPVKSAFRTVRIEFLKHSEGDHVATVAKIPAEVENV